MGRISVLVGRVVDEVLGSRACGRLSRHRIYLATAFILSKDGLRRAARLLLDFFCLVHRSRFGAIRVRFLARL
jgi:hypothetical protein